jgi:hypothetical protein
MGHRVQHKRAAFVRWESAIVYRRSVTLAEHIERLIGSIRREYMDHTVVFSEAQVYRILRSYAAYYNQVRTLLPFLRRLRGRRETLPSWPTAASNYCWILRV